MARLREYEGVQLPLTEEREYLQEVYKFYPGNYPIFPEQGFAGQPTKLIIAERISKKIHRLTGYRSLTTIHLYHKTFFGREYSWQRSVGTVFGAYAEKAHKEKLKKNK